MLRFLFLLIFAFVSTKHAFAIVQPKHARNSAIDENLQHWLTFLEQGARGDLKNSRSLLAQEEVASFSKLMHSNDDDEKERIISSFLAGGRDSLQHPLAPYFLEEARKFKRWQHLVKANNLDYYFNGQSCPQKRVVRELVKHKLAYDKQELIKILPIVNTIRSRKDKHVALLSILDSLMKTKTALEPQMTKYLQDFPQLKFAYASIMPEQNKITAVDKLHYLLHKRRCGQARNLLKKMSIDFTSFKSLAKKTLKCYRRINKIRYWYSLRTVMKKKYGFAGWAYATRQVARLQRLRNDFDAAKKTIKTVIKQAEHKKQHDELDISLFAYAKTLEDADEIDAAYDQFKRHQHEFPLSWNRYNTLKELSLIAIRKQHWQDSLKYLQTIKHSQHSLPYDERRASKLGFAMLWEGRANLELGKFDQAVGVWGELAREFHSSYYGAIAKYMLEKVANKKYSRSTPAVFEEKMHYDLYTQGEQIQVARALYLLQLGFKQHAACEIYLHPAITNGQMFAKSILLHAVGDWLGSVKLFASIDRSYKNSLPMGSEVLIFPKKFDNEIYSKAAKTGIDPFLAMALIRQESVFNPRALSVAGARGLMQIMPKTALYEVSRLKKPYIYKSDKARLKKDIRRSKNKLFNASTNILLGMHYLHRLIEKYDQNTVHTLSSYNAGIIP
ncbi:MAG: lytic transglycosylase domain-containing protein, partial [Pseudomonadota bacterium]|nr:lytic transglycosylase domain-containing protein [Pseudomonadota bacterium]